MSREERSARSLAAMRPHKDAIFLKETPMFKAVVRQCGLFFVFHSSVP
jgi:hypothetical protein